MIINNRHIEFSYNNTSSYYDGFANYIFEEHENIHAICLNMEKEGKVQLISAKAGATSQAVFDSASVIINLHMGLNNSYLDCEYISVEPDDKYIYRVYFITKYKNDGTSKSLAAIIGCIVGPVLLIASVGLSYWFKRLRRPNDAETPYNGLREENQETPLPESMYDSCFSENFSTMQPNNDILKCSDFSESCYHSYAKVNYLQCKPKLPEGQQRSTIIYNVPYDHSRRKH
ncbi:hypothetical protein HW555_014070 [Spodoptera exigua]|uniref:Uncharacterized protein n=1 Tax=Spodoptera exigua TaxID=7107 RepID=A0A835G469_SPOEX|nr:hypothetical protein HW555_014070 [Spodoptera exigua]